MKRNSVTSIIIGLAWLLMANSTVNAQTQSAETSAAQGPPRVTSEEIKPAARGSEAQFSSVGISPGWQEQSGISRKGYINIKVYVLRQFERYNPAGFIERSSHLVGPVQFRPRSSVTPKIEVGYAASHKFGLRASYFYNAQELNGDQVAPQSPEFVQSVRPLNLFGVSSTPGGKTIRLRQRLRMHVFDLDVTYKVEGEKYSALFSVGGRFAHTFQRFSGMDAPGSAFITILSYDQRRAGIGPTTAVDLRRKLGQTNFRLFGQGRFALLFGEIKERAEQRTTLFCCQRVERNMGRTTPVLEGEVGFEYARSIGGGKELLFSGSYAVQEWFKLVNVTPTPPVGTLYSSLVALDDARQPPKIRGNIGLFGGGFKVSIRF
jgi:hypothetical protein